jgi:hypothetical protein
VLAIHFLYFVVFNMYLCIYAYVMRTTIDLPEALIERIKINAAKHRTTMRALVMRGVEEILQREENGGVKPSRSALQRLEQGYALGGKPLSRDEIHAR